MTTLTTPPSPPQIRLFDPRRDLEPVANLIESCFADTLDQDGRRYIQQMRAVARNRGLRRWSVFGARANPMIPSGFVWEENGTVVGNLSLVPVVYRGRIFYLIANVAVDPAYRRQGIATMLTQAALRKTRGRRGASTWLHVRDDNQAAQALYTKLGFERRATRTTWCVQPGHLRGEAPSGYRVVPRHSRYWPSHRSWLDQNYPAGLRWHFNLNPLAMRPGFWGALNRFLGEIEIRHWAVLRGEQLLGVLSWQRSWGSRDRLWLAAPQGQDEVILRAALPYLRYEPALKRPMALDYPAGRAQSALAEAGFTPKNTLIWMEVNS